ncbi:hypothetical protein EI94DRAFT_1820300 [Lactarius quietus]|nr:hypothetical protein EI94DRAFT_1820300 [Lactarius quietus]
MLRCLHPWKYPRNGNLYTSQHCLYQNKRREAPTPSAVQGIAHIPVSRNNFAVLDSLPTSGLADWPSDNTPDKTFSKISADPIPIPDIPESLPDMAMAVDPHASLSGPRMKESRTLQVLNVLDVNTPKEVIEDNQDIFEVDALFEKVNTWDEPQWEVHGFQSNISDFPRSDQKFDFSSR